MKPADAMVKVVLPPVVDTAVPLHILMLFVVVPAFEKTLIGVLLSWEYCPVNDDAFGRLIDGAVTALLRVVAPPTVRVPFSAEAKLPTVNVLLMDVAPLKVVAPLTVKAPNVRGPAREFAAEEPVCVRAPAKDMLAPAFREP